jgi:hypothetical protein
MSLTLSTSSLEIIQKHCTNPEAKECLVQHLNHSKDPEATLLLLLADVNESSYPFSEWIESIRIFTEFNEGTDYTFKTMVGYIACSAEAGDADPISLPLPDVVDNMLQEYGFENFET